jgi:hypothetical protein
MGRTCFSSGHALQWIAALVDKRGKTVRRHELEQVVAARVSPRCTAYGPMGALALSFQIADAIGSVSPSAFSNDRGNQ